MAQNLKSRIQYLALALLLVLYLVVAFTHTYFAPLTTGPDELAHYEYAHFIADHGRLPLDKDERDQASYKSDQPPFYHLLTALPASFVDPGGPPYLKRVQDHKRRQLIERTRHAWGLYNTEDERWPYRGEVLRWQVGRWIAVLFGAATVAVTFFMAREVFAWEGAKAEAREGESQSGVATQAWVAALGAAAIVAFIPRFALTGSMLNYETTLAFFAALFLWVLLRMANRRMGEWSSDELKHRGTLNTHHALRFTLYALLLGLLAGLAITAKLSALILPLEIVLALRLIGRTYGWAWTLWLRYVLIAAIATLVAVSWWFGFVIYQFNKVAEDGLWVGLLKPLIAADSSDATTNRLLSFLTSGQAGFTGAIDNLDSGPPWEWLAIFFRTFWVVGIEQQQPLGPWGLVVALGLVLLAAYGLMIVWRKYSRQPFDARLSSLRLVLLLLLLHLFAAFILPLARYAATFSLADTAQGRHVLFQTVPAFAILLVWGILPITNHQFLHIKHYALHFTALAPGLFLLFWSGVQLWTMTWAYIPLLPVQTLPTGQQTQVTHSVGRPLNEFVTLLSYDCHLDVENQMLQVDLVWQATAISPVDYLTDIKLIDKQGTVHTAWLGYPANGRYPTRAWDIGDMIRDTVWLPTGGLEAGQYDLSLKLRAMKLKPVAEQAIQSSETSLDLGPITISASTPRTFNSNLPFTGAAQAAAGYSIWQNGRALTEPQVFRYRETILVTFSPLSPGQQRLARMVGPNAADPAQERTFAPLHESDMVALFIVGPDWPTGEYHLQVALTAPAEGDEQRAITGPLIHVIDRWDREFDDSFTYQSVEANFADQVKLLGYDLRANRAEAGGGIPLTLYWQGLDWMGDDYTIFTKLLAADQTVHGGRDRLPREGYSTLYWAPGEIVPDPFGVPVDIDAPDGIYYVNVGLYKQVDRQAISLPLVQDGQAIEATSINIGPIKIGDTPPEFTVDTPNPHIQLNQSFGNPPALLLLGYDLADGSDEPIRNPKSEIRNLKLTLYWRSEVVLPLDYTTFVHIRNEAGEIVAQKDQLPLNGAYPTSLWDPGEIIADEITIPLPAELPPGEYQIVVGLYDFQTGQRLPVPDNPANEVRLTDVKAP